MDRRAVLVEESFDHCLRNDVGTLADSIDLVVAQVDRFLAEQLATAVNQDFLVLFAG
jgi:hypothetical protein